MLDKPHALWSVSIKVTPTAATGEPGVLREGFILLTERLKQPGMGRGERTPCSRQSFTDQAEKGSPMLNMQLQRSPLAWTFGWQMRERGWKRHVQALPTSAQQTSLQLTCCW